MVESAWSSLKEDREASGGGGGGKYRKHEKGQRGRDEDLKILHTRMYVVRSSCVPKVSTTAVSLDVRQKCMSKQKNSRFLRRAVAYAGAAPNIYIYFGGDINGPEESRGMCALNLRHTRSIILLNRLMPHA